MFFKLVNFFIGACLASHALVIYYRFETADYLTSYSQCDNCGITLSIQETLPIISFLLLKGRCKFCNEKIPIENLLIEFLGGFAFLSIDFSQISNYPTIFFTFFLMLITIFDYYEQEFPTIFLLPLFLVSILQITKISSLDILLALPIIILFIYFIFKHMIGSGDLFLYIIFVVYFDTVATNQIFLIASILTCLYFLLENGKQAPFIPFIFLSLIYHNL